MTLNDFLVINMMQSLNAHRTPTDKTQTFSDLYDKYIFHIPRVVCRNGFEISIQISNFHYAASENGYRKFGYEWKQAEWGYPSSPIDAEKFNAETPDTTGTVGSCDIKLIEQLITDNGGIDVAASMQNLNGIYNY